MGIKNTLLKIRSTDFEKPKVVKLVKELAGGQGKVLDVGCGYGRNLEALQTAGVDVFGVEVNQNIVDNNLSRGLKCCSLEEFEKDESLQGPYDVLLMSHIIEHFSVTDLMQFLDYYLKRLKPGGHLVIATPLYTRYFYDDFDHVKPYHPKGILMFYGGGGDQVSSHSSHTLELEQLIYKKGMWRFIHCRGKYVKTWYSKILFLFETFLAFLFLISCGCLGQKDGWIGAFKKTS